MKLQVAMHKMLSSVQVIQCLLNVKRLPLDVKLQDMVQAYVSQGAHLQHCAHMHHQGTKL